MAQTILTPGGDARQISTPPAEAFPGLGSAFGLAQEPIKTTSEDIFKGLEGMSFEMSDKEQGMKNPFLDLPMANQKGFFPSLAEAYDIGRQGVALDRQFADIADQVLANDADANPDSIDNLFAVKRELGKKEYYNQGGNVFSNAFLQGSQMAGPMVEGSIEGAKTAGAYGTAGFAVGAGLGAAGAGVGAAPTSALFGTTAASAGFMKGGFDYWTRQGKGQAFADALEAGVNQKTAAKISSVVAPLYAAVEYMQVLGLAKLGAGTALKNGILGKAIEYTTKKAPEVLKKTVAPVGKVIGTTVVESLEEAAQGATMETAQVVAEAEEDLIKRGAADGMAETLGNIELDEASKRILSQASSDFVSSLGPLGALGLTSATVGQSRKLASWGVKKIATGELDELTQRRDRIRAAGAPKTADALAGIDLTAPTLKAEDTVGLEEDLEAAGVPIATATPVPTPAVEPVKVEEPQPVSAVKAPRSITKPMRTTLKDMGYSEDAIDKLAPQDALDIISGGEAAMVPPTPKVEGQVEPEKEKAAEAPAAKATAVVSAGVQPQAPKEGVAPVVPPLEKPEARPNILARNWLAEVDRAKNKREQQDLISIFRGKIDSLSEDERQASKIFDSELIKRAEAPTIEAEAPKVEAEAPAEMPVQPALPKWEDVLKNQNQIKFLKKAFKDANARLPKDQQIAPKNGWKKQDFFKALETIYGQLTQLEFAKPELKAPAPGTVAPQAVDKTAQQRQRRLASLMKVFSNPNLNGDQTYFRDTALEMARRISKQVAGSFPNLASADTEIYTRLVERIAGRLLSSVNLGRPILFNEKGQPTDLTEEAISKFLTFSAKRAGQDAINVQAARREVAAQFGTAPAEGAVTQPEAAREEAKPAGMQIAEAPAAPVVESKAVTALREAAKLIRDQSGPEVKLVIDWIVDTMIGADTELGRLTTYKDLADYLSKVANRKVSDKRVGEFVNKVVEQIAQNLRDENIQVDVRALEMLLTPEGRAARERKAAEEAQRRQDREVRQAIANLADRARNLKVGYGARQALVDAIGVANTLTRARITSEIIVPLEEGLIGENEVAQRLDNIQKGIENAKPRVRQAVPRRGRGAAQQVEEGPVRGRTGEGVEGERRGARAGGVVEGQPEPTAGGVAPVGARTGEAGREVGEKQPEAPSPVSVDPGLRSKNAPSAVKTLVNTATSSGFPASYIVDLNTRSAVSVSIEDADSDAENPVIRVNPRLLQQIERTLGKKAYSQYAFLAIAEEIAHFKYLKMLKREANELGISYRQHLKNETKRVAKIIKGRRGLKQKLEKLYNDGKPFTGKDGETKMVLEFMRMLTQEKMTGAITESTYLDVASILRSMEPQDRRFVFRFLDAIRQFLYGLSGRTAAETKFLRTTADSIAQMAQRVTRDLAKPNETLQVSMNYFPTKTDSLTETQPIKGDLQKAREELRKDTGLNRANLKFLQDYAKELGIKVPTTKRKVVVFNEKTRKHEEKEFKVPFWKKADYVQAIKAKLESLKKEPKRPSDEDLIGAAVPTDRPYWMTKEGKVIDVEETALVDLMSIGSHAEAAVEWLRENEPKATFLTEWSLLDPLDRKERQQMPVMEMFKRGWLRVVGDGFNLYFEGSPNQTQLDKLFESAINDEVKLIQDLSSLSGRARSKTLYEPPLEDEIGAAMPRHGFSTTEPKVSLDWVSLPDSLEGLEQIDVLPGTFDVRVYMDETGLKYVVKRGQTQEQFENEIAAENVYRILNYPVPKSKLITLPNGETAKLSEFIYGPTLAEFVRQQSGTNPEVVQKLYEEIGDGLLIDAFLFNYDVLGEGLDNIIVGHDELFDQDVFISGSPSVVKYTAYRIDNGGTLDTRATGLRREEPFFYDSFTKLQEKYPMFNLKASDVLAQISDLVLNSDQILNSIPERLRPMMAQRLQWMADQLSATDTMPPSIGYTDEEIVNHFTKLSQEMAAVEVTRNAEGQLINKRTGLPSTIQLLNQRGEVIRTEPKSEFRYRLERTPSFKMWFGDWENFPEGKGTSKILDASGEPLVMYHGTSWDKRQLSYTFVQDRLREDINNRFYPMRSFSTGNAFRGLWVASSRQFAEDWANESTFEEYNEQVVVPLYIKATNPFDPRNPEHIAKLIGYAREKKGEFTLNPYRQLALESGFFDWTVFEGVPAGSATPATGAEFDGLSETERKRRFYSLFPYTTLEAIINLGFDGVWVKEKELGSSGMLERRPKDRIESIIAARQLNDAAAEQLETERLKQDLDEYDKGSSWNLLLWRPDGAKSAVNSGRFKTQQQINNFKPTSNAAARAGMVKRNGKTLWNEYVKDGVTYVSYDDPEKLVSYAHMTTNELSKKNIAKDVVSDGVIYVGERIVPGPKSYSRREPADLLGAAMPRRFGVRLKDKVSEEAYAKLKNLNYEPIPDAMTEAEADNYLAKNGLRGSMDAALSDASPLQHGSRELLAQKIILGMNELYAKDKDPRILDDLLMFIDRFLEQSSGIGRALRALSFWSNLTPEGMLMLYKKKSDETNREVRDKFNVFFNKVKSELSVLPEGTIDEVLKKMSGVLAKAETAAEESRKRIAESNAMGFWEAFSNQMGESIADKASQQLTEAEAEAAQAAGVPLEEMTAEQRKAVKKLENAKSINQAAQEMSREIKRMFMALAEEQGRRIRDPRINTNEEFANMTVDEQEKLLKEEREAKQRKNFTAMLSRWPKALQAWEKASDAIRARTATNPELAEMFNGFLGLVLESPFTMPQLKRFISLRGVKLEDLIRQHYEEGKLANNAYSLAREIVQEAGLGAWEEETGADVADELGLAKYKREEGMAKEEPSAREKIPSLSERLTNAIALQIQEIVAKESEKKLNRLIQSYADKKLEPSLRRFANRIVQYQALGLFNNAYAWNEFQKQEGLDKLKPEVVEKIANIMGEAQNLVGYRKDEKIGDALSLIAFETQIDAYNFAKSWWYFSILSGIGTQFANFLGNATNTALLAIPTISKHLIKGYATDRTRSKAIVGSMLRALSLSFMDAGNVLMTGRVGTRKTEPKFFGKAATDFFEVVARNATQDNVKQKVGKISATVASLLRRTMTAVDMVFYNFNKEVYLFEAAYQKAEQAGLKEEAATAKALEYTFRNSEHLVAAQSQAEAQGYVVDSDNSATRFLQQAEQAIRVQEIIDEKAQAENPEVAATGQIYGTELTYNEEPRGVLGAFHRMIGSFAKEHPLKSAIFVPFTRIVANVWNQSIDFTGWGVMRARGLPKVLGKNLAGKFAMEYQGTAEEQKIQRDLAYVRGITGLSTVFMLGLLDQILCGNYEKYGIELCVNGQGPKEAAQKELLKNRLGWKPNSIYLRAAHVPVLKDGVYASYMFSPLAMGLSAVGLFNDNETYDYFNEKEPADVALAMAHRVATIMFDMNFLSGASDLFEMLNPSEPERALSKAKSFLSRLGSAMVVPNFVRDLDQLLISPTLGYGRTAREGPIQGAFVANTPIVRQIYGQTELDMLGQPVQMQFRPISFAKKDALLQVLVQKNALPTAPKKDRLLGVVKMTDEQYADFRKARAEQLGEDLGREGTIERLEVMTPEMAQLYVGKLAQKANAVGKAKIIRDNQELLQEVRQEKTKGLR